MTAAIGISRSQEKPIAQEPNSFRRTAIIGGCGANVFAANIAPTQEMVVLATSSSIEQLLGLMLLSLLIAAAHSLRYRVRRLRPIR
jgi:hypothetical protein